MALQPGVTEDPKQVHYHKEGKTVVWRNSSSTVNAGSYRLKERVRDGTSILKNHPEICE